MSAMIPDARTPEQIAQDFCLARPIRNCPWCGELAELYEFSRLDSFSRPFGEEYPETGVSEGYCPNCDAILEVWGRGRGDNFYEISCRRWYWNAEHTTVETTDQIFDRSKAANAWRVESMTEFATKKAASFIKAKWRRQLTGPHFRPDDPRFTVVIPVECAEQDELETLIARIRKELRGKRAGRLSKREDFPDRTELHFEGKWLNSYIVQLMWEAGEIPAPVTLWHYNEGRRYPQISWDHAKSAPSVHPSFLPVDERPKQTSVADSPPRLRKTATVEEALDWLRLRFGEIEVNHPELTDTAIRDIISDTLENGFLRPLKSALIPRSYAMDSKLGDQKIHRALSTFMKVATPAAAARGLSPQQLLDLMNQRQFDDFIGYRESV